MKATLKKEMKKSLRRLAKKHGVEVATTLVTGFLGNLAASKDSEREPEPTPAPPSTYPPLPQPYPPPERHL